MRADNPTAQPYKFLDYYDFDDSDIFFGREREIEILLSDIISTRLVVLFARTGSGKSSLINAGVRPRLEKLDYVTFLIRVEKDPMESAINALREKNLMLNDSGKEQSFEAVLKDAVTRLNRPIVLFFDQFEEFFIYALNEKPERAKQFISDIGGVYRDRESGVHLVFSMREEFFVEMDVFRDEIPSIFHNDSNLRLRWFDHDQARDAIIKPAKRFETQIEEDLVERLIVDLGDNERIEPARLQIVCDTLWRKRTNGKILLADYWELGGARQILDRRIEDDIDNNLDDGQLQLFTKLLPELSTERNTKYIRGFDELVKELDTDAFTLRNLVDRLKELRLIRESIRYGDIYIEWTSDYLVERKIKLLQRVEALSLRRMLKSAILRADAKMAELTKIPGITETQWLESIIESDAEILKTLYIDEADYGKISDYFDDPSRIEEGSPWELNYAEALFMFKSALYHGGKHMHFWYEQASGGGVPVEQILKDRIERGNVKSRWVKNTISLLCEVGDEQAAGLLEFALHQPGLGSYTLEALGQMKTMVAIRLLQSALQQDSLVSQTIDVLRGMRTKEAIGLLGITMRDMTRRQEGVFALQAGGALNRIATSRGDYISNQASKVLEEVLNKQAGSLFFLALEQGMETHLWFDKAIKNNVDAWEILREGIININTPAKQIENSIRLLGELEGEQAMEAISILEMALRQGNATALKAGPALNRIATRSADPVTVRAHAVLDYVLTNQAESLFSLALKTGFELHFWFEKATENGVKVWDILRNIVDRGTKEEQANVLHLLGDVEDKRAKELLEMLSTIRSEPKLIPTGVYESIITSTKRQPQSGYGDREVTQPGGGLDEKDWDRLLRRIKDEKCTPIIGPGVTIGRIPLRSEIAKDWAYSHKYPFADSTDLAKVAQFLSVVADSMYSKEKIREIIKKRSREDTPPYFNSLDDPHSILAELPLPVYITTNYDDFMVQALKNRNKDPKLELCRWNKYIKRLSITTELNPTLSNPLVFHFHGFYEMPESLVLTEDDYLDFLINISREQDLIPPRIQEALAGTSLLLLGYDPDSWELRVLLRSLASYFGISLSRAHVCQFAPWTSSEVQNKEATEYLKDYFSMLDIHVYWGDCREFAAELRRRWDDYKRGD